MVFTWRIWRALHSFQDLHPLPKRIWYRLPAQSATAQLPSWVYTIVVIGIFIGGLQIFGFAQTLGLLLAALVFIPALLLVFNGTTLGTIWVTQFSEAIVRETRGGRVDLLSITPRGVISINWLIARTVLRRDYMLHTAYRVLRRVISFVLILLLLVLSMIGLNLLGSPVQPEQAALLGDLFGVMAVVVAAWLDHIQSIVVAALVGVVLPTVISNLTTIRMISATTYLWLQVGFYLGMIVIFPMTRAAVESLDLGIFPERLLIAIVMLLLFYLLREVLIGLLWQVMLRRFQVTPAEVEDIIPY